MGRKKGKSNANFLHLFVAVQTGLGPLLLNSEGFLAEVFHPWVRWEGPGSGCESLFVVTAAIATAGVWKSRIFTLWDRARKTRLWNGFGT